MYKNIVIESNTNVFDNKKMQRVCDWAAHQMRMINWAPLKSDALLLHVYVFVLMLSSWTVCCCFFSISLCLSLSFSLSFLHFCLKIFFIKWLDPLLPYLTKCTSSFLLSLNILISLSKQYSQTLRMKLRKAILHFSKMTNVQPEVVKSFLFLCL